MIEEVYDGYREDTVDFFKCLNLILTRLESVEDKLNLMALFQENKSHLPVTEKQKPIRTRTEKQKESTSKKMKEWWAARKEQNPTTHMIKLESEELQRNEKSL